MPRKRMGERLGEGGDQKRRNVTRRSKLRKMCQNVRVSTKFDLPVFPYFLGTPFLP